MENDLPDLRYPIGKPNEDQYFNNPYDENTKEELLNDIKMLPAKLEYAIQNLDEHHRLLLLSHIAGRLAA